MKQTRKAPAFALAALTLLTCGSLTGCVAVGYSSGSGFFIWPGSIGLLLVGLLLWFLFRSR